MKNKIFKRLVVIVVTLALLLQMFPFAIFAAEPSSDTRVADKPTMTDWQNYFGETVLNTENAGGVWGDKSVFLDADDFNDALEAGVADYDIDMDGDSENFLVALSAIAANKSIVGYSALPTDTMFVLDLSNSMSDASMTSMINATNAAIRKLQALNLNNRIGVVVYAGTRAGYYGDIFGLEASATVLLPIGRYEGLGSGENETFLTYSGDTVSVAEGVLDLAAGQRRPSKSASGATYIQAGMQLAVNEFKAVEDTVIESGPQAGTMRMPVMVLMSDGAPTAATTSINDVGNSNLGTGSSSSSTSTTSYVTQLTCAWARKEMSDKYSKAGLFYTLGLNVGSSANARAVLDPANATAPFATYWAEYLEAAEDGDSTVTQGNNYNSFTVPVVAGVEQNYVDEYFPASNDTGLINAFDLIVDQIIIQSKYYPTLVDDGQHHLNGYITFNDELGVFMEVKEIKGLTVNGNLYRGSAITKALFDGEFGNIENGNLSGLNSEGFAFLKAIEARLGCTQDQAGAITSQAILEGQLYYNNDNDFSNYIGWYSDIDGNFLGFWNGKNHDSKPDGAVFANKSYGFMGTVGSAEEFNLTDMLHISVQVRQHITLGHQSVIYKIPAALIPTINYNITFDGNSLETGSNFKMTVDGAKEALRLVFEVGLRDDINRINVADKVAEYEQATGETYPFVDNGVYTFYSNAWEDHTHTQDHLVDNHDATWLEFEPSLENERYYYTANAPIYEQVGTDRYELIDHDPTNTSGTYYTQFNVFYTDSTATSSARMEQHFKPVDTQNIKLAKEAADGTWYVPKGTVYRILADSTGHEYRNLKEGEVLTDNSKTHPTKTLNYSNYPAVVFLGDGSIHCDACLGNNGMFTMTAAQGIKLSKTVEVEGLGEGESFEFKIALTPPSGETLATSYPIYDEQGNYIKDGDVVGSVITYNLTEGQTIYIADLPTGTAYTVTESASATWAVASKVNDTGVVTANHYNEVVFENTPVSHGNLIIHKQVVLPEALGADAEYNEAFNLEVFLENSTVLIDVVQVNGVDRPVVGGKLNLSIKDDETILISGIPDGTTYSVTETGLNDGIWTASQQTNQPVIDDAANTVVNLTNIYNVKKATLGNISHKGIKNLVGREWLDSDHFEFSLEYYNGANWVSYNATDSATKADKTFSFDDVIQNLSFDRVGTYHFRIVEHYTEIGGVDYDVIPKRFEIEVVNNFETGKLEIANVTTATPKPAATAENPSPAGTVVTKNGSNYEIETTFNNLYSVAGTANAVIEITKQLENQTGVARDKSGFEFELYQLDGNNKINVEKIGPTDETGTLVYSKAWGATFVGQTFTYWLAEIDSGEDGVVYDLTPRKIEITIVDNLDGTVSAHINGTDSNIFAATFENSYELTPADIKISGTKEMLGRDIADDDVIKFELYRTDENFENRVLVDTAVLTDGAFTLGDTAPTAGEKHYIVKEKATNLAGVKDDTSVYYVTVEVKKGEADSLISQIKSIRKDDLPAEKIVFENVYAPYAENYVIKGTKTLEGRDIVDGEFSFVLKDADGKVLQTKTVKDGKFVFDPIEIEKKGEYVFTVSEVRGDAEGVTYDSTVYTVTLTVADDGKANLSIEDKISTEAADELDEIVFKNSYTKPVVEKPEETPPQTPPQTPTEIPKTGDFANLSGWTALFFISGGAIIALIAYDKKRKRNQN